MRILFAEMDTYENELKFQINKQQGFHRILQYLDSEYLLLPYKKSLVTDYYYDYNSILLELGASYRIRYRPNISLNLKIPHHNTGFIISRQEFTMKAETKDVKARLIQMKDCVINQLTKRILGLENLALMEPMAVLQSERVSFAVKSREKDVTGSEQFIGVAFFDKVTNMDSGECFYEFELEAYADTDHVYISPYVFEVFQHIGSNILLLGYTQSMLSKYERAVGKK